MTAFEQMYVEQVKQGSFLDRVCRSVANPRKHRWNAYLRACRSIPKGSCCHGSTSFKKLNMRRAQLINKAFRINGPDTLKDNPEFKALQKATSAWLDAPMIVGSFVMSRRLRRLTKALEEVGG